ncbi:MAG TPA: HAMP domain-containing sensor histidine kinase [Candidatus Limnocylindria bacterium]|nr:HAMP domain-containing sensor histidine kinase [Candidatus Limnocylindria bacterium]
MAHSLSLRLLAIILVAALPPLAVFALLSAFAGEQLTALGLGTTLLLVSVLAAVWATVVAVVASRSFASDLRRLVALAERGQPVSHRPDGASADAERESSAFRRLAALLDERNRQMRDLAESFAGTPITHEPVAVARHVVRATRAVARDSTWSLAVLAGEEIPAGVYGDEGDAPPTPLTDLQRWAGTAGPGPARIDGPWGSFVAVEVGAGDAIRAILLAPWEGRPDPTPAELTLFSLLAQHTASVLEHSILYRRVHVQAAELDRLSQVQADFLRGVTHDLQTPLTSIGALAGELLAGEGLIPSARADLEAIVHQADRLRRMVAQLLTLSGLEARAIQPRREVFRTEPIVRRVWSALRAEDRQLVLQATGPDRLAVGDPARFEQVIWSLLDNALKYSASGSPIEVTLACHAGDPVGPESGPAEHVEEIAITDHGIGMDAMTRHRAFERFYRAPRARDLAPDGSGIGLFTAAGLVELMGGRLDVRSEPDAGTTITVSLPAEVIPAEAGAPTAG